MLRKLGWLGLAVAPGGTVVALVADAFEDPLRVVALISWDVAGVLDDLPDPGHELPQPRPTPGCLGAASRRRVVLEDPLERLPVHPILAEALALADLFDQHAASDRLPLLHVSAHPRPPGCSLP